MSAGDWTFESEAAALADLRAAAPGADQRHVVLVYARQSVSDFDQNGSLRGPSLQQQVDTVSHRAEFANQRIEVFQDADRSGKETSRRGGYLHMLERIRTAAPGEIAAVASYDIDRLHRNDLEFFRFMAEMAERRILVFDSQGLVSAVDQLPWKVKAIVAQEERVNVARRVRDNLRYLKRAGHLLGVIPQGYVRVDGAVVEDPEVAPGIRQIFELYATGRFSFQTLADHLNGLGIRPKRGPAKAKHNRPAAVIFTGDVLKDIFDNPSYLGKIKVDGQLIEAKHPALIDDATWNRCLEVRRRNRRNTSKTWTRHSYPLTPILLCGRCGSTMHGEISSNKRRTAAYYACHAARRNRSATMPHGPKCDARWIAANLPDEAIRDELRRCVPSAELHAAYREQLGGSLSRAHDPRAVAEAAVRRLDDQLARIRRLYELASTTGTRSSPSELRSNKNNSDYATKPRPRQTLTTPSGVACRSWICWPHGTLLTTGSGRACSQDSSSRSKLRRFPTGDSSSPQYRAAHGSAFFR